MIGFIKWLNSRQEFNRNELIKERIRTWLSKATTIDIKEERPDMKRAGSTILDKEKPTGKVTLVINIEVDPSTIHAYKENKEHEWSIGGGKEFNEGGL